MRVLLADRLHPLATQALTDAGFDWKMDATLAADSLREAIVDFNPHVLVVRSTRVTAEQVHIGGALSLVVRAGAGVNTIDLAACSDAGIFVGNCPGRNAVAVAELTMGLMIAIDRQIADNVQELRAQRWDKKRFSKADGLKGKTLGLLGMGRIGQAVARRAKSFDLDVVAWSRSLTPEAAMAYGVRYAATPTDVAAQANILSVHLAATDETRGMLNRELFAAMPDGAVILNTSRAELIDEDALLDAIDNRGFRAGLDVFVGEPQEKQCAFEHRLAQHPAVYGTHHIGASTTQAQMAVAQAVVESVISFRQTGSVPHGVNLAQRGHASHCLVLRHLDRVGVLAAVLDIVRAEGRNIQEMDNILFQGGNAACARIQLDGSLGDEAMHTIRQRPHILHASVLAIPSDKETS
jgi:D-3-phosphoglycerate dehydrogenase